MAKTTLRFEEGMKDFICFSAKNGVSSSQKLAVGIYLDEEYVGLIGADGKITIIAKTVSERPYALALSITFTETQLAAIALRAKEFKERCAIAAQEQKKEVHEQAGVVEMLAVPCLCRSK